MPFELGLDVGCQRYGAKKHKEKVILILDKQPFRYQKYLSDIAGQDIEYHSNKKNKIICCIRDWYNGLDDQQFPSGEWIYENFKKFNRQLPNMKRKGLLSENLSFPDYSYIVSDWLSKEKEMFS